MNTYKFEKYFKVLKPLLKQYAPYLQAYADHEYAYNLLWPDGTCFASLQVRGRSLALFIDRGKNIRPAKGPPSGLAGSLDPDGWFILTTNCNRYLDEMDALLLNVFVSNSFGITGAESCPEKKVSTQKVLDILSSCMVYADPQQKC